MPDSLDGISHAWAISGRNQAQRQAMTSGMQISTLQRNLQLANDEISKANANIFALDQIVEALSRAHPNSELLARTGQYYANGRPKTRLSEIFARAFTEEAQRQGISPYVVQEFLK